MEHVHGWTADGPGEATRGRTRRKRTGKFRNKLLRYMYSTCFSVHVHRNSVYVYACATFTQYIFGKFLPFVNPMLCVLDLWLVVRDFSTYKDYRSQLEFCVCGDQAIWC